MKILVLHNRYQIRGGEDQVVEAEVELLRAHGHEVNLELLSNDTIQGFLSKLSTAMNVGHSQESYTWLCAILEKFQPDIVHIHNFFPLLTPSAYDACKKFSIPVVQSLHNFRLFCSNGLFLREGKICELCLHGSAYHGVVHGCYRESRLATIPVAHMIEKHRTEKTWQNKVDQFIAITEFSKQKFVSGGVPAEKISVKQNFVEDPSKEFSTPTGERTSEFTALFVGRLSQEKGVTTLLNAWKNLDFKLTVIGEGPLLSKAQESKRSGISVVGKKSKSEIFKAMNAASILVIPSECYEGFPMVAVEAMAMGLPILASDVGAIGAFVKEYHLGDCFKTGNANSLSTKLNEMATQKDLSVFRKNSRMAYERFFTPQTNYDLLLQIYKRLVPAQ